jgi:glutamate racemase
MVESACLLTKTKIIAVCATPTTLASTRYHELIKLYGNEVKILEPDCSDWSAMIEHNQIDDEKITSRVNKAIEQNADVIVLGCTHYHWIEDRIKQLATTNAVVLQPEQDIINELRQVLEQLA